MTSVTRWCAYELRRRDDRPGTSVHVNRAWMAGLPQSHRAYAVVGEVQILAQSADDLQTGVAVPMQELEQILALDDRDLGIVQQLRRHFMDAANQSGAESENLSRTGDAQGQLAARFRAYRELGATLAKHENAASRMSLAKKGRTTRVEKQRLQTIKVT